MSHRICRTCNVEKPLDAANFYFDTTASRFRRECILCLRAKQNAKYANDRDYRERKKARNLTPEYRERKNAWRRERWANDQDYREAQLARQREKYHNDKDFRESTLTQRRNKRRDDPSVRERDRQRWATDPEYRGRILGRQKHKYHNNQEFRERRRAYERNPEVRARNNAWQRERWSNNQAFREAQSAKRKEKYRDPEYRQQHQDRIRFRLYGLTREEYAQKVQEQEGLCAICYKKARTKLLVDHHHESGQVRGLLCRNCNWGIGRFEENAEIFGNAIEYFKQAWLVPREIPTIIDESLFARFEIPHWEGQSRDRKFRKEKNTNLRRAYGINLSQYEWLLAKGGGVCWICHRPETRKRQKEALYPESLYVDHDHATGMIRGLLCNNCNSGIGYFDDNLEKLKAAIAYLEKWDWLNFVGEDS